MAQPPVTVKGVRDAVMWRPSKRRGFTPDPDQEALPPGPPPRAVALGTINLVGCSERGARDLSRSVLAPLRAPTNGQIAKGLALCWRSRRQSLLAGSKGGALALRLGSQGRMPRLKRPRIIRRQSMAGMMEGKVAVVTGAGGGIGREIAIMMAAAGAKIIVADIGASLTGEGGSATPAQQTKALIEQKGGVAEICTESVAAWGSAQKIVQAALDHFGRIDAVVNNAGILRDVIFHKMTEDDWLSVIAVHLNGSFFVSRAAAEHYRKQESGTFVHISSTSGLIGNFGQANYSAAKLGITALSKSIAL